MVVTPNTTIQRKQGQEDCQEYKKFYINYIANSSRIDSDSSGRSCCIHSWSSKESQPNGHINKKELTTFRGSVHSARKSVDGFSSSNAEID
jgi:hypothetical protein